MDSTYTLKYQGRTIMRWEQTDSGPLSVGTAFNDETGEMALSIKVGTSEMFFTGPLVWEVLNRMMEARGDLVTQIDRFAERHARWSSL